MQCIFFDNTIEGGKSMKLLVVTPLNPYSEKLYSNFVHDRLKLYKSYDEKLQIEVIAYGRKNVNEEKHLVDVNNIRVTTCDSVESLYKYYKKIEPDVILIHFFNWRFFDEFVKKVNEPILVWVHGVEALSWKRRLFNFTLSPIAFLKYILSNIVQLNTFSKLIDYSNQTNKVRFVFVSKWMREICFKDVKNSTKNYEIIPNVIDTQFFEYKKKSVSLRRNILIIKSFESRKYANDISIRAILHLSKNYDKFKELKFTIIGYGRLWNKLTKKLDKFDNITLINKFLTHEEIKRYHSENGIFLTPTRQDSQGVSMCEAMSSGLVPISSNNTAIPEFLNREAGYLTNNYIEIAKAIEELNDNPELFSEKSIKAANLIRNLASFEKTIKKEIDLINSIYQENKK